MIEENSQLQKTCLYDKHIALGAKMSPFGGFIMPIEYSSIIVEHNAVRLSAGIFDVSHMGEIIIKGKDAEHFVNYMFTNDISGAPAGKIFYGLMLYPEGGTVDDLLVYKKSDTDFLLVVNASNISKDMEWIESHKKNFDVQIENLSDSIGEIAIQGPAACQNIEKSLKITVDDLAFYTFKEIDYNNEKLLISRTGYTGEDGFELYASPNIINKLWDLLLLSGSVQPCGLGCRDTLRFEVGLPLYGHELSNDITPMEAGLSVFVNLNKETFIGKSAMLRQKMEGLKQRIVGIELNDKAIPRNGYDVEVNGQRIGYVTTGYNSISTGKSVCMALIDSQYAAMGTKIEIRIRKKTYAGIVVKKRFYDKKYKK